MNEPCRILMTFSTPQTSEKPAAMQAYSPPSISPLARICSDSMPAAAGPLLRAEPQLALLDRRRVDHRRLALLDLEHRRLERVDLPRGAELHRPPEGGLVEGGERVAHLGAVGGARLLDRHLQDGAGGGRRGLSVIGQRLVFRLEALDEGFGAAEQVLALVAHRGVPPGGAGDVLRQLAGGVD